VNRDLETPLPHASRIGFDRVQMWASIVMIAASFVIYATAVLIIHKQQRNDFFPERSSIAAAVSNVVYGAPLGTVYSGLLEKFLDFRAPLDETLAQAARQEVAQGTLLRATADGNGIGYMVITSVSMRLFGLHGSSSVMGMLILMGISAFAFVWRYRDERAAVVILYFTSLTVMLFTPIVWSQYATQISIGGIRYFSLVAILPAFHLLLECADTREPSPRVARWKIVPMAAQVVVLLLAVLVRNAGATVIAAIVVGCVLVAWWDRREPGATRRIIRKTAYMAIISAVFVGCLMLSVSRTYLTEGRFTETVWHRIFVSLQWNPAWPFGNLRQIYDCTRYIPAGLGKGEEDQDGHCILWVYAMEHHIPVDIVPTMTYGREYDAALREAFFNILRLYPAETLKTFVYYKPQYILWSIGVSADLKLAGTQPVLIALLIAALGNLLAFELVPSPLSSLNSHRLIAGAVALFASFSMSALIAAWANPSTSGDLAFYCIFGLGLAGTALIHKIRDLILPPQASLSSTR
jgi:hypothetical protein